MTKTKRQLLLLLAILTVVLTLLLNSTKSVAQNISPLFDSAEINCLIKAVYHEARGEPSAGREAVAKVVLNRVNDPRFGNSICEVVYQPKQFTNIHKTVVKTKSIGYRLSKESAIAALNSNDYSFKYLYFQHFTIPPRVKKTSVRRIGQHIFF